MYWLKCGCFLAILIAGTSRHARAGEIVWRYIPYCKNTATASQFNKTAFASCTVSAKCWMSGVPGFGSRWADMTYVINTVPMACPKYLTVHRVTGSTHLGDQYLHGTHLIYADKSALSPAPAPTGSTTIYSDDSRAACGSGPDDEEFRELVGWSPENCFN